MVAGANVMKGGGYESAERYAGSNIQFMDIGNIHGSFRCICVLLYRIYLQMSRYAEFSSIPPLVDDFAWPV